MDFFNDGIPIICNAHLELFGPDGGLKEERWSHNKVTSAGLCMLSQKLIGLGSTVMCGIALGTNTTPANDVDTSLSAEVCRVALTRTIAAKVVTYVAVFPAGTGTAALTEAGILSHETTAGMLLCRLVFDVINKGASDALQITWTVTFASNT